MKVKIFNKVMMAAALCACAVPAAAKKNTPVKSPPTAKYIFYFIGDGMGMGHVNTTETYNRDVLKNTTPILMMNFPVSSQVRTYSHNSPITDSAAAGTALSTGHKTNNSMVGMLPDSTYAYSISRDFMQAGYNVGVATTVAGDDATPAAFYAHAAGRTDKVKIGEDAVSSNLKFLGAPLFKAQTDANGNPTAWEESMTNQGGFTLVRGIEEFDYLSTTPDKLLMLARTPHNGQAGYTIDSIPGALTLTNLTEACLRQVYNPDSKGFFMMVEAGNIDWAAHANDGGAVVKEILNFQNAIQVAYDFYLQHPEETLIVITADHDTGGMAIGREDAKNNVNLNLIDSQRISKDRFADSLRKYIAKNSTAPTLEQMLDLLQKYLGFESSIQLTDAEKQELTDAYNATFVTQEAADSKTIYNNYNHFTELVFSTLNRHYGIGFTTRYHTGNPVPLFAIGAESQLFTKAMNNTEVPMLILKAAGLESKH